MRNLKRVLSLALACVMVIGMMVMTTGAADFDDAAEINYTEAVDVMSALGILEGYDGNFNPDQILTREQAAKIICYMLMGPANAEMLNGTAAFSDVEADRWSAPFIGYCSSLGIIAGYDGYFDPTGELTGVAFAKLLLVALGYDAEIEGYVNNKDWATNIGSDAVDAGINIAGVDMDDALTREQAAQMALNAIKTPMVKYATKGSSISVNGAEIVFGSSNAEYVTTTLAKEQRISKQTLTNSNDSLFTVEFGEKYFPNLVLDSDDTDVFGRPANTWTYKTEEIGTYVNFDLLVKEYTSEVKYGGLYNTLSSNALKEYDFYTYEDGAKGTVDTNEITRNNMKSVPATGNGVLTQVFVDHDKEFITIASINTYVAEVASVTEGNKRFVTLTDLTAPGTLKSNDVTTDEFAVKDIVAFNAYWNGTNYSIYAVEALDIDVNGILTEWIGDNKDDTSDINFAIDDITYEYSENSYVKSDNNKIADFTIDKSELNVYMDDYGYALYVAGVRVPDNYAVLIGCGESNQYGSETRGATLLMPDGTKKEVIAQLDKDHVWPDQTVGGKITISGDGATPAKNLVTDYIGDLVTYTVLPNGTYSLNIVDLYDDTGVANKVDFTNGKSWLTADEDGDTTAENYYTTSNTIFFVATPGTRDIDYKAYTGYGKMPSLDTTKVTGIAMTTVAGSNVVKAVYITADGLKDDYVLDTIVYMNSEDVYTNDLGDYYIMRAIVDGKVTTEKVDFNLAGTKGMTKGGVYALDKVVKNKFGVITGCVVAAPDENTDSGKTYMYATGIEAADGIVVGIDTNHTAVDGTYKYWAYTDETLVFVINTNGTISTSSVESIATDNNDVVYFTINEYEKTLEVVVIKKVNPDDSGDPEAVVIDAANYAVNYNDPSAVKVYAYNGLTAAEKSDTALLAQIKAVLQKNIGYTKFDVTEDTGVYTIKAYDNAGGTMNFKWNTSTGKNVAAIKIKVDGKDYLVNTGNLNAVVDVYGATITLTAGTHAKVTKADGTADTPIAIGSAVTDGYAYSTGWTTLTATPAATGTGTDKANISISVPANTYVKKGDKVTVTITIKDGEKITAANGAEVTLSGTGLTAPVDVTLAKDATGTKTAVIEINAVTTACTVAAEVVDVTP